MRQSLLVGGVAAALTAGVAGYYVYAPNKAADTKPAVASSMPPAPIPSPAEVPAQPRPAAAPPAAASAPGPASVQAPVQLAGKPAETSKPAEKPAAPAKVLAPPRFDIVHVSVDGGAVIAGRGTPGATVTILDGTRVLGTVIVDRHGEWVLLPNGPLPPGSRELSLTERRSGSDEEVPSEKVVVLVVPEPAKTLAGSPATPDRSAEQPAGALALAVPRDGSGASQLLQAPALPKAEVAEAAPVQAAEPAAGAAQGRGMAVAAAAPLPDPGGASAGSAPPVPARGAPAVSAAPGGVVVQTMDYDSSGRVALGGRAGSGSDIQLYLDNRLVGRTEADAEGRWHYSPDNKIEPGRYTLRADQLAGNGKVTSRVELPVQVADLPESLPDGRKLVVQPGNSLWRIARASYGQGVRYTTIYEANRSQIRDPDLIYPGQIFELPVVQ